MIEDILTKESQAPIQLVVGKEDLERLFEKVAQKARQQREILDCVEGPVEIPSDSRLDRYISRKDAAAILDVHTSTLWRWVKDGHIKVYRHGNKNLYKLSEIRNFLNPHEPENK